MELTVLSGIKRLFFAEPQPLADDRWRESRFRHHKAYRTFSAAFHENLASCRWEPHPQYSVFTQYDQDFYLREKDAFTHKYKCFYAVSKTISPRTILELGTHAGASADAYISATPTAEYIGIDEFGDTLLHQVTKAPWRPREVAEQLFQSRGFTKYQLITANLREMQKLPASADFVVVDAAHDYHNEYADLKLALTASPRYIFVDDSDDENQAQPAIETFLRDDVAENIEFLFHVNYTGGGLVIKLKN